MKTPPFEASSLAPTKEELEFIYNFIYGKKFLSVLEFGCGVTTWAIHSALAESSWTTHSEFKYVAMEHFEPCIQKVKEHIPNIEIVQTVWNDIPKRFYDLVFIDSSAGFLPPNEGTNIYRKEAMIYIDPYISPNGIIIIHDYHRRQRGHKQLRNWLDNNPKYELVQSFKHRSGVGVYRKK